VGKVVNDPGRAQRSPTTVSVLHETSYGSDVSEIEPGLDELLRALANPHRRQIVQACWGAERTAGALSELLGLAPASTSEHLKVLRKHRLVDMRVEGTFRIYRSRPEALAQLSRLLATAFPQEEP